MMHDFGDYIIINMRLEEVWSDPVFKIITWVLSKTVRLACGRQLLLLMLSN